MFRCRPDPGGRRGLPHRHPHRRAAAPARCAPRPPRPDARRRRPRHVIGKAVGILMGTRRLTEEQALDVPRRFWREGNIKLRAVARHLCEYGNLPWPMRVRLPGLIVRTWGTWPGRPPRASRRPGLPPESPARHRACMAPPVAIRHQSTRRKHPSPAVDGRDSRGGVSPGRPGLATACRGTREPGPAASSSRCAAGPAHAVCAARRHA
ncbi:ANTAR domain-containing protein [Streptomyces sp. NPDC050534]|uniref:ANTAR domain-containing protein n=1 Tax=Streptomyces sp. NPDC050534 TaxID=3365625 RepID=UPI0037A96A36